jgi:hypothetical protein
MFELRRMGLVAERLAMVSMYMGGSGDPCCSAYHHTRSRTCMKAGTNGTKFPTIRQHFRDNISARYNGLNVAFESFPSDDQIDPLAYVAGKVPRVCAPITHALPIAFAALNSMSPGDVCIIFTPDDTHYTIAKEALTRGLHVLVTKPLVHTLHQHISLVELAESKGVLLGTEVPNPLGFSTYLPSLPPPSTHIHTHHTYTLSLSLVLTAQKVPPSLDIHTTAHSCNRHTLTLVHHTRCTSVGILVSFACGNHRI